MQGFKLLLDSVYMYFVSTPLVVLSLVFAALIIASAALVTRALDEESRTDDDK